jgi:DNA-binding transcriptional regulator YdaS (Cro superfamily)
MNDYLEIAADVLGGRNSLARAANVSQPAVSKWMNGRCLPSAKAAILIELATGGKVTRVQLRPDIFQD